MNCVVQSRIQAGSVPFVHARARPWRGARARARTPTAPSASARHHLDRRRDPPRARAAVVHGQCQPGHCEVLFQVSQFFEPSGW